MLHSTKIFTLWQTPLLWTLTMLSMRAVAVGALNVYSYANHNDTPSLKTDLKNCIEEMFSNS